VPVPLAGFMRTATVTIAIVALRRDVNGGRVNSPLKQWLYQHERKRGRIAACDLGNTITQLRDAMSATFKPRTMFAEIIDNKFAA
jgi:hypothetical protein